MLLGFVAVAGHISLGPVSSQSFATTGRSFATAAWSLGLEPHLLLKLVASGGKMFS